MGYKTYASVVTGVRENKIMIHSDGDSTVDKRFQVKVREFKKKYIKKTDKYLKSVQKLF